MWQNLEAWKFPGKLYGALAPSLRQIFSIYTLTDRTFQFRRSETLSLILETSVSIKIKFSKIESQRTSTTNLKAVEFDLKKKNNISLIPFDEKKIICLDVDLFRYKSYRKFFRNVTKIKNNSLRGKNLLCTTMRQNAKHNGREDVRKCLQLAVLESRFREEERQGSSSVLYKIYRKPVSLQNHLQHALMQLSFLRNPEIYIKN